MRSGKRKWGESEKVREARYIRTGGGENKVGKGKGGRAPGCELNRVKCTGKQYSGSNGTVRMKGHGDSDSGGTDQRRSKGRGFWGGGRAFTSDPRKHA